MKKLPLRLLLFALPCLFAACHKKQLQEKPSDLIAYSEIVDMVAYSYLIESDLLLIEDRGDSVKQIYAGKLYQSLLDRHGVTKELFATSMEFYLKDEDHANTLNQDVVKRLETLRREYAGESPDVGAAPPQ